MKILPVTNYQTQAQNTKKQNVNFEMNRLVTVKPGKLAKPYGEHSLTYVLEDSFSELEKRKCKVCDLKKLIGAVENFLKTKGLNKGGDKAIILDPKEESCLGYAFGRTLQQFKGGVPIDQIIADSKKPGYIIGEVGRNIDEARPFLGDFAKINENAMILSKKLDGHEQKIQGLEKKKRDIEKQLKDQNDLAEELRTAAEDARLNICGLQRVVPDPNAHDGTRHPLR